jgi:hypothetical protein
MTTERANNKNHANQQTDQAAAVSCTKTNEARPRNGGMKDAKRFGRCVVWRCMLLQLSFAFLSREFRSGAGIEYTIITYILFHIICILIVETMR